MNRRKAIGRILIIGTGSGIVYFGSNLVKYFTTPDLNLLNLQLDLISDLSETIIPKTDTPGAKEAGVGIFIIKMIKDCANVKAQHNFLDGLKRVEKKAYRIFGKSFSKCSVQERISILEQFQLVDSNYTDFIAKAKQKLFGAPFFTTLKKFTVIGYFSSKLGATEGLSYDYIPGKFSNTGITTRQKSWATK